MKRYVRIKSLIVALTISLFLLEGCGSDIPPDAHITTLFNHHEGDFVRLRDMLQNEPAIVTIGKGRINTFNLFKKGWIKSDGVNQDHYYTLDEVLKETSLSPTHYQEYLHLLDATKASLVFKTNNWVFYEIACPGFLYNSPEGCKYILYRSDPPQSADIVDDTDAPSVQQQYGKSTRYAKIKEGWYIQRSW